MIITFKYKLYHILLMIFKEICVPQFMYKIQLLYFILFFIKFKGSLINNNLIRQIAILCYYSLNKQ